tara:strand:+ start:7432 stop:7860 length:429 start_codon:yes stop_codon:yes gene_type:complete
MKDIIFTDQMDPKFLLKNIKTAYSSSPFYEHFEESLSELFNTNGKPKQSLLEFNLASIKWVENELGISNITISTSYMEKSDNDYRNKQALISSNWNYPSYPQVFEDRNGFISGRSILDAIFHVGPEAKKWWTDVSLNPQQNT